MQEYKKTMQPVEKDSFRSINVHNHNKIIIALEKKFN